MISRSRLQYLPDVDLLSRLWNIQDELDDAQRVQLGALAQALLHGTMIRLSDSDRNWAEQVFCMLGLELEEDEPERTEIHKKTPRSKKDSSPAPSSFWWDGKDRSRPWNHPTRPPAGKKPWDA